MTVSSVMGDYDLSGRFVVPMLRTFLPLLAASSCVALRVAVTGATGRTGRLVVEQCLAAGQHLAGQRKPAHQCGAPGHGDLGGRIFGGVGLAAERGEVRLVGGGVALRLLDAAAHLVCDLRRQ